MMSHINQLLRPLAQVLLLSGDMGCCLEALGVVAMVSAENVFFTPRGKAEEAAEARRRFVCPYGDHTMMLQVPLPATPWPNLCSLAD